MTTADCINLAIGIFASLVAFSALIWNVIRDKPKIRLRVELWGNSDFPTLESVVMNTGKHRIHIYEVGFTMSNDFEHSWGPSFFDLPIALEPGKQWSFSKDVNELTHNNPEVNVIKVWVQDGFDRRYQQKVPKYWD